MRCCREALGTLLLGLPAVFLFYSAAIAQAPPAPKVTVAPPIAKHITTWDEYSGRFEAVESVEVRPRVSGFVDKVHFKDGQIVKAGDPLFTIDPRPFEIAAESARAEIVRAKATVALALSEVERAAPLVKSGAVTERDYTQRSANLSVTEAQLQVAEANLKNAELNLEWTIVKAPISGRISDRKVDIGNLVIGGAQGTTLLTTIVSLDPIHFLFDVSESDYLRYSRLATSGKRASSRDSSNPVRIRLSDETDWPHEGAMDFVDNQLNPRSGTMRGRALVPNKDQLFAPGIFARLRLFGGEVDALLVPDASIVSDQMKKMIFVVGDDGQVQGRSVTLGPIYEGLRVVTAGIEAKDKIIIDGLANPMVRPGTKVTVETGEIKAAAP
ncbi:MAG: efflux RND transporter periplasmic adaptor subunit [Hyphomicrobium sp.]|jgi:multidrug efflux system membrane fusion protein|uniref:efflux RND transporter periplasmic adaptor subunit n=1 Tax=Hyphomicrobium sp. TaxID=82 RepID=UPI0025BB6128|nr:efflux RND transporter periplasmic adaptor subunit [Hyphomicrobium sp.]MBX9862939.1 efflux RND transporter periplasmic adaptor subunit [Hyphomicrobium sp.]